MAHNIHIKCNHCGEKYHVRFRVYKNPQPFELDCKCGNRIGGLFYWPSIKQLLLNGFKTNSSDYRYECFCCALIECNDEEKYRFVNLDEDYADEDYFFL